MTTSDPTLPEPARAPAPTRPSDAEGATDHGEPPRRLALIMVSLILALVLHRIDQDPEQARAGVELTELFVDDMDGQMRQIGFGDMVVGKQIGRMVGALGGRLGAYRAADGSDELRAALVRNLWRGKEPPAAGLAHVMARVAAQRAALAATPVDTLVVAERLPE